MSWIPINWGIIKNPLNWAIIVLMLLIFAVALDVVSRALNPQNA